MLIFVINLERDAERLKDWRINNPYLCHHAEIFPAVDGSCVRRTTLLEENLATYGGLSNYTNNAIGCALSHLTLWRRVIELNESALILEDDTVCMPGCWSDPVCFEEHDFVSWGYNFDMPLFFDIGCSLAQVLLSQATLRTYAAEGQSEIIHEPTLYRLHRQHGTPAYTISPRGARIMHDACFPISNNRHVSDRYGPNLGIDCAMNRVYEHMNAHVAFPPTVITPNQSNG